MVLFFHENRLPVPLYLDPQQKVRMNHWLRTSQYWYNRMLGERFDWWEQNRCAVNACPLLCH